MGLSLLPTFVKAGALADLLGELNREREVAVILVNTWLSFPYMFLISTGALQAIPAELQEAARVDGASGWKVFWRITFPLLMVSLAPLLIASFAFAFNNFLIIYLLTNGGPPILDAAVPVGSTDILITFTFDLAFAGSGSVDINERDGLYSVTLRFPLRTDSE